MVSIFAEKQLGTFGTSTFRTVPVNPGIDMAFRVYCRLLLGRLLLDGDA